MEIYIVRPGDTVDTIADAYGISAQSIIYNNQLPYPYPLAIGQALLLSAEAPLPLAGKKRVYMPGDTPILLSADGYWSKPCLIFPIYLFSLMDLPQKEN